MLRARTLLRASVAAGASAFSAAATHSAMAIAKPALVTHWEAKQGELSCPISYLYRLKDPDPNPNPNQVSTLGWRTCWARMRSRGSGAAMKRRCGRSAATRGRRDHVARPAGDIAAFVRTPTSPTRSNERSG